MKLCRANTIGYDEYVFFPGGTTSFRNLGKGRVPVGFGAFDCDRKTGVFAVDCH